MGSNMIFFRKKGAEPTEGKPPEEKPVAEPVAGAGGGSIMAEITRMKAQMESFSEVRKVMNERFSRVTEQIGEMRGMILEAGKDIQRMEVKTTKSVSLVESIEPDKFLVMIRKQDVKIEALKSNIESNEARMDTIMNELKGLRNQMSVFRGIDQVMKLTDDVKAELTNIRKINIITERHADKVSTFFSEIQKRVRELDQIDSDMKEIKSSLQKLTRNVDQLNVKTLEKAEKKEVEKIIKNFKEFEEHTANLVTLLTKEFNDYRNAVEREFDMKFQQANQLNRILKDLSKPSPELKKALKEIREMFDAEERRKAEEEARKKVKRGVLAKIFRKKGEEKAEEGKPEEGKEEKAEGKETGEKKEEKKE